MWGKYYVQKGLNKEFLKYHLLIRNFIKHQAFEIIQKQIFKVSFARKSRAKQRDINVTF